MNKNLFCMFIGCFIFGCATVITYDAKLPKENEGGLMFAMEIQKSGETTGGLFEGAFIVTPELVDIDFISEDGKKANIYKVSPIQDYDVYIKPIPIGKYKIKTFSVRVAVRRGIQYKVEKVEFSFSKKKLKELIPNLPENIEIKNGEVSIMGKLTLQFEKKEGFLGDKLLLSAKFESDDKKNKDLCEEFLDKYSVGNWKDRNDAWGRWYLYWGPIVKKYYQKIEKKEK